MIKVFKVQKIFGAINQFIENNYFIKSSFQLFKIFLQILFLAHYLACVFNLVTRIKENKVIRWFRKHGYQSKDFRTILGTIATKMAFIGPWLPWSLSVIPLFRLRRHQTYKSNWNYFCNFCHNYFMHYLWLLIKSNWNNFYLSRWLARRLQVKFVFRNQCEKMKKYMETHNINKGLRNKIYKYHEHIYFKFFS